MFSFALYISSFVFLSLWFFFKDQGAVRRFSGRAFLLCFAAYAGWSFLSAPAGQGILSSSLLQIVGLVAAGFVLNTFSNSRYAFFTMMLLMGGAYSYFYFAQYGIGKQTLPSEPKSVSGDPITDNLGLDEAAELLVEVANGRAWADLQEITQRYGLTASLAFQPESHEITDLDDVYAVNIPEDKLPLLDEIVRAFEKSKYVDFVERNERILLSPGVSGSAPAPIPAPDYGLNDPLLPQLWSFQAMRMKDYFALLRERKPQAQRKARIVIIDTGVDADHEDLREGFVSIDKRYNQDVHGHGTHCAGIAAAVGNNKRGIASFSVGTAMVEVSSIRVFDKSGSTSQQRIVEAMLRAADKGAAVLSMSLGGPSNDKIQRAYEQAVDYANTKGAIVVVAAGNENVDARLRAPANAKGVITVAAIDEQLQRASFSNTVNNLDMGLSAPGVQIYSTYPDGKYEYLSGTSMATPYVAGLIGVLKALRPELKTKEAYNLLQQTGLETQSTRQTGKLIHPAAALQQLLGN